MVLSQRQKIEEAKKICLAVFGTLVFSIGVNVFIVPIGLYNGGFVGIGQVVLSVQCAFVHIGVSFFRARILCQNGNLCRCADYFFNCHKKSSYSYH